jgi:glucokinase
MRKYPFDTQLPVLGLDVGGTYVRFALALDHCIIASRKCTWPAGLTPEDEVHFITDEALKLAYENESSTLGAVGISLAALVDRDGSVVQWPNRPTWRGLKVRALLEEKFGVPVAIEDDANTAALAEYTFGAARGYQHVLVVMVGTGVGAGLILNGRLFRGLRGWAGELGHVVMLPEGPECSCGHRGCLQMLVSGRALERSAIDHGLVGARELAQAAEQGKVWAIEAVEASGRWLGLAVANVVTLLDLEAVVVGGGVSALGRQWWHALNGALRANILNSQHREIELRRTELADTAGLLGAVSLAHNLLEEQV